EVIVAFLLWNVPWRTRIAFLSGHPDPSIVAQRLRHQRELRLILAALWNACRMDLREAGIGEVRPAAICPPDRRAIRRLGIRGEIENVGVATAADDHRIGGMRFHRAR